MAIKLVGKFKEYKLVEKLRPFLVRRILTVLAIWGSLLLLFWFISCIIQMFLPSMMPALKANMNFNALTGSEVLAAIAAGLLMLNGLIGLIRHNFAETDEQRQSIENWKGRSMDEVSSAATHLACAKLCVAFVAMGVPGEAFEMPGSGWFYLQLGLMILWAYLTYDLPTDRAPKKP